MYVYYKGVSCRSYPTKAYHILKMVYLSLHSCMHIDSDTDTNTNTDIVTEKTHAHTPTHALTSHTHTHTHTNTHTHTQIHTGYMKQKNNHTNKEFKDY